MGFNPPLGPVDQVTHVGSKEREFVCTGREQGWLTADYVWQREMLEYVKAFKGTVNAHRPAPLPPLPPPNETMTKGRMSDVLRDIERPPQMLGYEGSPWPWASVPLPIRKWLAAYLGLAGVLWAFAELTKQ